MNVYYICFTVKNTLKGYVYYKSFECIAINGSEAINEGYKKYNTYKETNDIVIGIPSISYKDTCKNHAENIIKYG